MQVTKHHVVTLSCIFWQPKKISWTSGMSLFAWLRWSFVMVVQLKPRIMRGWLPRRSWTRTCLGEVSDAKLSTMRALLSEQSWKSSARDWCTWWAWRAVVACAWCAEWAWIWYSVPLCLLARNSVPVLLDIQELLFDFAWYSETQFDFAWYSGTLVSSCFSVRYYVPVCLLLRNSIPFYLLSRCLNKMGEGGTIHYQTWCTLNRILNFMEFLVHNNSLVNGNNFTSTICKDIK